MSTFAELILDGQSYEFPVVEGTQNEKGIDISTLRSKTGYITLDYGFKNTGSTQSAVTFLDGEKGILKHRGYSIEELCEKSTFLEVANLLIYGNLPNKAHLASFTESIKGYQLVHENYRKILEGFPSHTHPMGILSALATTLNAFHPEALDPHRPNEQVDLSIQKLMGKLPTFTAWAYTHAKGIAHNYPKSGLGYVENFLHMMFSTKLKEYEIDPVIVRALEKLLILHADHEQNCSASTVRIVGSSNASIYASVAAGINALWGPLHGGANQGVIQMLDEIQADGGNVEKYINKAKDKDDPFRLMGFGHRVYKNFDPRAKIIKKDADAVLAKLGVSDPILDIAKKLEETALQDSYFIERKLFPNVDFYSGIILKAIGIPTLMFPVMFAMGRLPGWIAQWKEMRENKEPIGRPRQIYTGNTDLEYKPIEMRS
ncbi:citrate synthase [Persicobacter psychrovividus]|uniref:Citrate synthase n=1 Tax=Persicobacter psychrovividus TaxID=387638 RepID=A0ABM7VKL6_9BACT|nr:citrate synthase [Persicobacter psychrovividus]